MRASLLPGIVSFLVGISLWAHIMRSTKDRASAELELGDVPGSYRPVAIAACTNETGVLSPLLSLIHFAMVFFSSTSRGAL